MNLSRMDSYRFLLVISIFTSCGYRSLALAEHGNDLRNRIDRGHSQNVPMIMNTWNIQKAPEAAWAAMMSGSDAVESIVEGCGACDDGSCGGSIGKGGSPDERGETTLDAMIMDGTTMDVGSVACLRGIEEAIHVAHDVLRYTDHTLLVGDLAADFALSMGYTRTNLQTNSSYNSWQNWMNNNCQPNFRQNVLPDPTSSCGPYTPDDVTLTQYNQHVRNIGLSPRFNPDVDEEHHDTIGMVAIDPSGSIAAGCTTNGANRKVPGRVGDSPIVGSGAYAEDGVGAAACTGDGDVMMRMLPSFHAVNLMRQGFDPYTASEMAVQRIMDHYPNNALGIVAISATGEYGGACHRFSPFQYNMINATGHMETATIPCI